MTRHFGEKVRIAPNNEQISLAFASSSVEIFGYLCIIFINAACIFGQRKQNFLGKTGLLIYLI